MSAANSSSDSDQNVTYRISDDICGGMALVIVKEEAVSDVESSSDEFYEFVETSLPVDVVCSELQDANKTPEHGSILLNLLSDSALQNYQHVYRDDENTLNTDSKSSLKLHLVENEDRVKKCQKKSKLSQSLELVSKKVVQIEGQKSETETQVCKPGKFKSVQCNKAFGHKNRLQMHEIGHEQCRNHHNSFQEQEVIIVKEEVLSDDEVVLNDVSADKRYNTGGTSVAVSVQCFENENDNSVSQANNSSDCGSNVLEVLSDSAVRNYHTYNDAESASGSNSKSVNVHLVNNKDRTRTHQKLVDFVRAVNVNVKKLTNERHLKTARSYMTPPVEYEFKCQECSETFELKSHLVMHEISHEQYRRYESVCKQSDRKKRSQSDLDRKFKCKECSETFELKSHLVMHEISHEQYRRYESVSSPIYAKQSQSGLEHKLKCKVCCKTFELKSDLVMHKISHLQCRRYKSLSRSDYTKQPQSGQHVYKCKECNAVFELRSIFIQHELLHKKQSSKLCRCRSVPSASVSDLCTCVVRVCILCSTSFFASVRLRNWTLCIRCFLRVDRQIKKNQASAAKTQASKRFKNKMTNGKLFTAVTDIKRLCYSCGEMCVSVVKYGPSWMCNNCWSARFSPKWVAYSLGLNNETLQQESAECRSLSCTYCLRNHECFDKSLDLLNQCTWFDVVNVSEDDDMEWNESEEEDEEMVIDTTQVSDSNDSSSSSKVILCERTGELIDLRFEADTSASDKNTSHAEEESSEKSCN
jgi:hypothetical protein